MIWNKLNIREMLSVKNTHIANIFRERILGLLTPEWGRRGGVELLLWPFSYYRQPSAFFTNRLFSEIDLKTDPLKHCAAPITGYCGCTRLHTGLPPAGAWLSNKQGSRSRTHLLQHRRPLARARYRHGNGAKGNRRGGRRQKQKTQQSDKAVILLLTWGSGCRVGTGVVATPLYCTNSVSTKGEKEGEQLFGRSKRAHDPGWLGLQKKFYGIELSLQ